MKKPIALLFITCSSLFVSCSTVSSSYHYTKGTEYLSCGNFPEAIIELEQAAESDPTMARNYTNLAVAYIGNKNPEQGWYCCRQAVRCPYDDGICRLQFAAFCKTKITQPGLNKPGTSWEEISQNLGAPDEYRKDENGQIIFCAYGTCEMSFSNELLTSCTFKSSR